MAENSAKFEMQFNIMSNKIYNNQWHAIFNGNRIGSDFNNNTTYSDFTFNQIEKNFESNDIRGYFTNNVIGKDFIENTIRHKFKDNIVSDGFQYNMTEAEIQNIDFTLATHVYQDYSCTIYKKNGLTGQQLRLRFFDDSEALVIDDIDA